MLVRVAIARWILDGTETDVSQAVNRLCEHLGRTLPAQARASDTGCHRQGGRGLVCLVDIAISLSRML